MSLKGQRVIVVGGSSGMGLGCAKSAAEAGAEVIIASHSPEKLEAAKATLAQESVSSAVLDITDEAAVKTFFSSTGGFDHLIITASGVGTGPFVKMDNALAKNFFDIKFWGAYSCAKYAAPVIAKQGSITFVSGDASRRPMRGLACAGACNGALEALGKALAAELAPIRVNTISPGLIDTPLYAMMPEEKKAAFFDATAKQLPAKRIGYPNDIAEAAMLLMTNGFITGTVLDVDGGNMVA